MQKRWQKNLTITKQQADYIKANRANMSISELSKMLGLTTNKVHNNMRLIGLVTPRKNTAKVVAMDGYFDSEAFFEHYKY